MDSGPDGFDGASGKSNGAPNNDGAREGEARGNDAREMDAGGMDAPDKDATDKDGTDKRAKMPPPANGHSEQPTERTARTPAENAHAKPVRAAGRKRTGRRAEPEFRRDTPVFQANGLSHFFSTSRIPRNLDTIVTSSLKQNTRLDHILIHGAPGSGTALLASALIRDYAPRSVIEIDAVLGCDGEFLRRSIDEASSRNVLYIRHIDALDPECDQILAEALGSRPMRGRRTRRMGPVDPSETDLDRAISESASRETPVVPSASNREFTLIATAHMMPQVGYLVRTRFEQMFHLRDDPKALRNAVLRALRRSGPLIVEPAALPQLELVLKTLSDSAEPVVRAMRLRIEEDALETIDAETMRSILEEDLAARLPDEAYAMSLRRHLGGRRIEQVTRDEVARVASETGWGTVAAEAAISVMIREDSRRRVA
jgi:hypothetical protein